MYVDKDSSPLGKLSERLAMLPVRKARLKELNALVDRAAQLEDENDALWEYALGLMANSYRGMGRNERKLILESELIALLKDGWVLDESQQWRKVEKGKCV